jgi:ADP-heptose:LPS heptosyltransferase
MDLNNNISLLKNDGEAPKFLLLRFSSIGDILLTTPLIRCLKKQFPNAIIHFATKASFSEVLNNNPHINRVIEVFDYEYEIITICKKENYTYILDLQNNSRTAKLKNGLRNVKAKSYSAYKFQEWLLLNFKINKMPNIHLADRFMDTINHLQVKNDGQGLDFYIPEIDKIKDTDLPLTHRIGYIGIVINGSHFTKKLPIDKWKQICKKIEHPIVLIGGKSDYAAGKEIALTDEFKIYNACGKYNLNENADIIKGSKFILTNENDYMQIAAAFKKPIISIWGSSVTSFGKPPYYGNYNIMSAVIENKNIGCRPCSSNGLKECPKKHFKCMQDLSVAEIVATVNVFLGK